VKAMKPEGNGGRSIKPGSPAEADLMTNGPIALVTVVAAAAVIETMLSPKPAPRFVWNVSESVPTGLYQVQPARDLIVTTLVVAYPPEPRPRALPP
jgi:type IV secretory pathway protease TraF